jgi:hypothetical protein
MNIPRLVFLAALVALAGGCVSPTPVTPAPISAEDAPKMSAALLGTWQLAMVQDPGGSPKADKGIHITFNPDGKLHYRIETPGRDVNQDSTYRLDGRNIVSDGVYKTMRVDEWRDDHLVLFVYDTSKIFHLTRERG